MTARIRDADADEGDVAYVQAVLDYVQVQARGRDLRIGLLGFDADNKLCYMDTGNVTHVAYKEDDGVGLSPVQYCGFSRNFLSNNNKSTYKPRRRKKPDEPPEPPPASTPLSAENHAKRVTKLLEEEEKSKEKTEKKRLKKLRQREKKRQAKLESEKQNQNKGFDVEAAIDDVNGESIKAGAGGKEASVAGGTSRDSESSDSSDRDSSEDEDSDGDSTSGTSEELDMTSSFVSKAVDIAKRQQLPRLERRPERNNNTALAAAPAPAPAPAPVSRPTEKPNGYNEFKKNSDTPSSEDVVKISTDLAVMGNKFASSGHFAMAVKYFTDAIKYNPKEYRLFGNRSFCYEKLQEYERALTDAELSLNMSPSWAKGLYRKGRALAGLQRYDQAAQTFKQVLQLDSSCADAAQELMRVQITQLMEFGFSREQSSNALIIHGTVKKSLEALSKISGVPVLKNGSYATANTVVPARTGNDSRSSTTSSLPPRSSISSLPPRFQAQAAQAALVKSQQTQAHNTPKTHTQTKPTPKQLNTLAKTKHGKPQQAQQLELFPVWVGNLISTVTEAMVQDMFSTIGEVHSVKFLRYKRCAFVNFLNQQNCDDAIEKFHGEELADQPITVRYPDRMPTHLGISKTAHQSGDQLDDGNTMRECFFWRHMGCTRRPGCPFKHILEHKGIDMRKTSEE